MKKLLLIIALCVTAYFALGGGSSLPDPWQKEKAPAVTRSVEQHEVFAGSIPRDRDDAIIGKAFAQRESSLQVFGRGRVEKILPDDIDGSRHQRFILRLESGLTLLVSHNIDLAPRIESLNEGDTVAFHGEYEWNPKGGVIHWTHHDPQGRHPAGWLKHGGQIFQ